jgi:hypothetical protein
MRSVKRIEEPSVSKERQSTALSRARRMETERLGRNDAERLPTGVALPARIAVLTPLENSRSSA